MHHGAPESPTSTALPEHSHTPGPEHSSAVERHLECEWQLFQRVEAGDAGFRATTWEATRPVVVVGWAANVAEVVFEGACRRDQVPIVRRRSGGGAVVLGPGCLNYAVVLGLVSRPTLLDVSGSFREILGQIAGALVVPGLGVEADTDLAIGGRKVSGNAQRRGRRALMHHGTLLYAFDSGLASRYLREPRRQPAYRGSRQHVEFLGNLPLPREAIEERLARVWSVFAGG